MKKLIVRLCACLALFVVSFVAPMSNTVYAADFELTYSVDERTSYSAANPDNVVKVKMIKPNYVEEYWIQYFKDWFVVRDVFCENIGHMEAMRDELYARQAYEPNPRVTSVKNALLAKGAFQQPLNHSYLDTKVADEQFAVQYIEQFIKIAKPELLKNGGVVVDNKITDGDNVTYYYVNVLEYGTKAVRDKFQINQYGEIFYFEPKQQDYLNVDNLFVIK